jgi:hypothetical protein
MVSTLFRCFGAAELLLNFCAHAVRPFFANNWNFIDTAVVSISMGTVFSASSSSSGIVKLLRIFRVLRAVRIFGRISQLREIIRAIAIAFIPAFQALVSTAPSHSVLICHLNYPFTDSMYSAFDT